MTPFGLFMRTLRLEKGLLLKDMADAMGVSSAYLSALEHGKKGAPNNEFITALESKYQLGNVAREQLRTAVRDSNNSLAISPKVTPLGFETAHAFARKLPNLSESQLRSLKKIIDEQEKQ